jgi:hypothetical protein
MVLVLQTNRIKDSVVFDNIAAIVHHSRYSYMHSILPHAAEFEYRYVFTIDLRIINVFV